MSKLKKPISIETTFGVYVADEIIGEGGVGRVYGGVGIEKKADRYKSSLIGPSLFRQKGKIQK